MQTQKESLAQAAQLAAEMQATGTSGRVLAGENVTVFPSADQHQQLRILEAVLFAASEPLDETILAERLPNGADLSALLELLSEQYRGRGITLVSIAGRWAFRTAEDLSFVMRKDAVEQRRLSRAALETLAIIAYHQPVTRSEIEDVRGVSISKGTLDTLLEMGWIKMRGRRRSPGRPVTYGTTSEFLNHFGLAEVNDLPGASDLKAAGLLDNNVPADFIVPEPTDVDDLDDDEDPLDSEDFDELESTDDHAEQE
jgi:segregation and condensation protein B